MKIILLYVASLDGKVTKWGQSTVREWASLEDQAHFRKILKESKLIVMGSSTFKAVHPRPAKGTLRIILTREPQKYTRYEVKGQLEFIKRTPEKLVKIYAEKGYKQMLLVSGRKLTTAFFNKRLVDELWLTLEPKLFGAGDSLISEEKMDISLELLSTEQLNKQGTLLLKYKVLK